MHTVAKICYQKKTCGTIGHKSIVLFVDYFLIRFAQVESQSRKQYHETM